MRLPTRAYDSRLALIAAATISALIAQSHCYWHDDAGTAIPPG